MHIRGMPTFGVFLDNRWPILRAVLSEMQWQNRVSVMLPHLIVLEIVISTNGLRAALTTLWGSCAHQAVSQAAPYPRAALFETLERNDE